VLRALFLRHINGRSKFINERNHELCSVIAIETSPRKVVTASAGRNLRPPDRRQDRDVRRLRPLDPTRRNAFDTVDVHDHTSRTVSDGADKQISDKWL
jgi:hypothetical protein